LSTREQTDESGLDILEDLEAISDNFRIEEG
jgi:hypothetical protein